MMVIELEARSSEGLQVKSAGLAKAKVMLRVQLLDDVLSLKRWPEGYVRSWTPLPFSLLVSPTSSSPLPQTSHTSSSTSYPHSFNISARDATLISIAINRRRRFFSLNQSSLASGARPVRHPGDTLTSPSSAASARYGGPLCWHYYLALFCLIDIF
jgi:hypothetical protein